MINVGVTSQATYYIDCSVHIKNISNQSNNVVLTINSDNDYISNSTVIV